LLLLFFFFLVSSSSQFFICVVENSNPYQIPLSETTKKAGAFVMAKAGQNEIPSFNYESIRAQALIAILQSITINPGKQQEQEQHLILIIYFSLLIPHSIFEIRFKSKS